MCPGCVPRGLSSHPGNYLPGDNLPARLSAGGESRGFTRWNPPRPCLSPLEVERPGKVTPVSRRGTVIPLIVDPRVWASDGAPEFPAGLLGLPGTKIRRVILFPGGILSSEIVR
ncbi:hypothetical protein C8R47DRAFT_1072145 [Mycena vitilis]|nr:hypothetical protein C8R47DRAFT_1083905 [Mycena vitilis]KAJ6487486.1 hypothetical protein C8R47DRAFT_1072145 [Mycena vitilis]